MLQYDRPVSRTSKVVTVCLLLAAGVVLAGCGGSGSKNSGGPTTTSSHVNTSSDPANAILKAVGLEECSERQLPATALLDTKSEAAQSSFGGARIFETAADCSKKGPRTTVVAATFSTHAGIAAGKAAFKRKYPRSGVASHKTVVVAVVGGENPQQTADEIVKLLSAGVVKG
jgi:uncharacterized protein YceK